MPRRPLTLLLIALLSLCPVPQLLTPAQAVTDEEVEAAMVRMEKWLFEQQKPDGSWEIHIPMKTQSGGETAMAVYALLARGNNFQDPRVEKGIKWLQDFGAEMQGSYAVGVRSHVWASLPDSYRPALQADTTWLLQAHKNTLFDYKSPRKTRVDHSVTQYGQLGLWEAAKRGVPIPPAFWQESMTYFIKAQQNDGGWTYSNKGNSYGSMTCVGITLLAIAQQQIPQIRNAQQPPADLTQAINKGILWLDREWKSDRNPGRSKDFFYYLYGVERVALATGVKEFKGEDWFAAGAEAILKEEKGKGFVDDHGDEIANTAFALSFLARGRVPVWISKVAVPGQNWNNRPNDLYFVTRYLSDLREGELNWQVVSINDEPARWTTPVAWLASDTELELTEPQIANLRGYIDGGGLLVFNPDADSSASENWMQNLGTEMYPDLAWEVLPQDHPLRTILVDKSRDTTPILRLNNGVRDLVIMPGREWGREWQTALNPTDVGPFGYARNLQLWSAGHEALPGRLETLPLTPKETARGTVKVAMAKLAGQDAKAGGEARVLEAGTYAPFRVIFGNRTGYDLDAEAVDLANLGQADPDLVHLAGINPVALAPAELDALTTYIKAGGTVLIENLGGRTEAAAGGESFSFAIEKQLAQAMPDAQPQRLTLTSPLISGQGLTGGYDISRVKWRAKNVSNMGSENRLRQLEVSGRPAVIIADDDLSLGVMGNRLHGTNGYHPASARQMMTNILLQAKSGE